MDILEKKTEVRSALAAISLRSIAKEIGLSAQTVSNFFTGNNNLPISDETRSNIEKAVRESLEKKKRTD